MDKYLLKPGQSDSKKRKSQESHEQNNSVQADIIKSNKDKQTEQMELICSLSWFIGPIFTFYLSQGNNLLFYWFIRPN